nr:mitochondrial uncoupling protein 2-like isoform X2 [Lepeophtheirus salmonis]
MIAQYLKEIILNSIKDSTTPPPTPFSQMSSLKNEKISAEVQVDKSSSNASNAASTPQQFNQTHLAVQLLTAGTAACIADTITFPLDTVKVRLQIQGEGQVGKINSGVFETLRGIVKTEGVRPLYNGLVPGLQRQMAFSGIRLGSYESVKQFYIDQSGFKSGIGLLAVRIAAGATTGTLAILSAQPTDVVKIRMQAETRRPGEAKRYTGVMNAYTTIGKTEGFKGLYRGTMPNIARNCIINISEIVVYDIMKETLMTSFNMKDGVPCHFTAAVMAGFAATLMASPVDVIKTRFMNSPEGKYRGVIHCAYETGRNEGISAYYKGFNASFSRLVTWNIFLWLVFEQMKKRIMTYNES